jgi:hypothetical protein
MSKPVALTDSEVDIVLAAARPLSVQDRDPYLKEVAARLAAMPERGDGLVYQSLPRRAAQALGAACRRARARPTAATVCDGALGP